MVRQGILQGARLWPLPERTPLNPVVRYPKKCAGYIVRNVALETFPGFYSTGNLYTPAARDASPAGPAVLCPHGHFEREGGRFSANVQSLCGRLAQSGITAFAYDMVGWGESLLVSHTDPNVSAYQLWNSIRAVDFLVSLPGTDGSRIGITGASGGGTQSFMLAAVDDRIHLSAPVAMVSATFFGGCVCETGMPIHVSSGTNNVEIAALAAPRPQLIISLGTDFTADFPDLGYPFLRKIYALYGATDSLQHEHLLHEPHDYGPAKQQLFLAFVRRHFFCSDEKVHFHGKLPLRNRITIFAPQELKVNLSCHTKATVNRTSILLENTLLRQPARFAEGRPT